MEPPDLGGSRSGPQHPARSAAAQDKDPPRMKAAASPRYRNAQTCIFERPNPRRYFSEGSSAIPARLKISSLVDLSETSSASNCGNDMFPHLTTCSNA